MPIKTVRAHPEIIRRVGLGAQQCVECGAVYIDTAIPETCDNGECPTNRMESSDLFGNDLSRTDSFGTPLLAQAIRIEDIWACPKCGAQNRTTSGATKTECSNCYYRIKVPHHYHITEEQGKAIQQRLLNYANYADHSEREGVLGWRIRELAKLFE